MMGIKSGLSPVSSHVSKPHPSPRTRPRRYLPAIDFAMRLQRQLTAFLVAGSALGPVSAIPSECRVDVASTVAGAGPIDTGDIAAVFVADLVHNATQVGLQTEAGCGAKCKQPQSLVVDVGYAKYEGYHNDTTELNYWKGYGRMRSPFFCSTLARVVANPYSIRYATAPTGQLRWQPPQSPAEPDNVTVTKATGFGPICPQSLPAVPGAAFVPGDEDCLFLNVYAPKNANGLPVLVYIHGGGYGLGDGTQDMTEIINSNEKKFIVVTIQYRVSL